MFKVYIDGQEGTTGLRIIERFKNRSDIEVLKISDNLRKDITERKRLINAADVVFLCLPDQASVEAINLIENENVKVIDASTAHRTNKEWDYGFPELSDEHFFKIQNSKRVSVPGCHASGFIAIVYPLINMGIIDNNYPLTAFSITGYSGGGKKMINDYNEETRDAEFASPRVYGLTQLHKHLPEMVHVSKLKLPPVFQPIVCDYYSGMIVSIPLQKVLLNTAINIKDLHSRFTDYYANQPFIKVMPFNENGNEPIFLGSNNIAGKDYMEIHICGNDERITIMSRFDNLGKGASGAATQCMNIMLGLDPKTGLVFN